MSKITIDGIEKSTRLSRSRDGWTWFYVVENGLNTSEHSVPTHWWLDDMHSEVTTGGHTYGIVR